MLPPIYLDNIVRYVREGGALLIAAGPDFCDPDGFYYSPLGQIAPARPDGTLIERGFRARVVRDGAKHPVTRGLPGASESRPPGAAGSARSSATLTRGTR